MADKPLLEKLLLKPGVTMAILNPPPDHALPAGAKRLARGRADAVLVYAKDRAELEASWDHALTRLREDGRLWIAYPKAGKLATDLNRDRVAELVQRKHFDTVRQVAIDETWSALWVKPLA